MGSKYSGFSRAMEVISNIIFPENIYCMSCGNLIDAEHKYGLCSECIENVSWIDGAVCEICGKELSYDGQVCYDCQNRYETYIVNGRLCVNFNDRERDIVHQFKYGNKPFLAKNIAEIMMDRLIVDDVHVDFLVPVPMHPKKKMLRGYNQADLLAEALGKLMNVDVLYDVIVNRNYLNASAEMGGVDRRQKAAEAFEAVSGSVQREKIRNKRLMLIDDVYTTGSTMQACARVLREMGAGEIYSCAFASAGSNMFATQVCG